MDIPVLENVANAGVVIGELLGPGPDAGKRFCAKTRPGDDAAIEWLLSQCRVGAEITVQSDASEKPGVKANLCWFEPAAEEAASSKL